MALNWQWTDQIGYYETDSGQTYTLYEGNALAIAVFEWKETKGEFYNVVWFWTDKEHAKYMLGIGKDSERYMQTMNINCIHLKRKHRKTKEIINLILRSDWEVEIHVE